MKAINKQFLSKGYRFKQIHRDGVFAVYERLRVGTNRKHYEVIKIQSHNGYSIAGKAYPASEYYPSSRDWGTSGFTYLSKRESFEKIDKMTQAESGKES